MRDGLNLLRSQLRNPGLQAAFDKGVRRARREKWVGWIRSYSDALAVANGCYFDAGDALFAVDFIEILRHSKDKWAGQRIRLLDWQKRDFIMPLFGWKRANGWRRFRKAYVEIPKKNGKSTLCAAIEILLLVADGVASPEVYCAAKDRKQASIIFREAASMVRQSPSLKRRLKVVRSQKRITYEEADGFLEALSADAGSQQGLNISGLVIDELHVHKNREMFDTLWYGADARDTGLIVVITTAGEYDESSIGWEQHTYAQNVIAGTSDDWEFFALIYAADVSDDWTDPKVWYKSNPSLGHTIPESAMAAAVNEAQNAPSKIPTLLRYRFNIWVQAANAWMDKRAWIECGEDFTLESLRGRRCYGGMDLSSNCDTTSFQLVFTPTEDDPVFRNVGWYWLPADNLDELAKQNRATYGIWREDGWIETTTGDVVDLAVVRSRILELKDMYDIQEIAFDPWRAEGIVTELEAQGLVMVKMRQGVATMSDPMNQLERLVLSKQIRHDRNPVTVWQIGNVVAHTDDNGNIKPDKKNQKRKIDGPVALIMATGRAVVHENEAREMAGLEWI